MQKKSLFRYRILLVFLFYCPSTFSQPDASPLFTFGVVADVQYADQENAGTRYYRLSRGKFAEAVEVFNQKKVDFVVSLGDFIDKNLSSYDTLNPIARSLKMPIYHVLGNHEFTVNDFEKDKILQQEGLDRPYYSILKKGWRLIFLDGNDISLYANKKESTKYKEADTMLQNLKNERSANAQPWNGAIGEQQLNWLVKQLAEAKKKKEKVLLANHFPLYPDGEPELLWNAKEVRKVLESYPNVFAYFNGHVHKSQYHRQGGVNYVTFRGMVELDENAFAIVYVYKNRIEIKGYGKEVSRMLRQN